MAELVCTHSAVHFQCDSVPPATRGVRSTVARLRRLTATSKGDSFQLMRETGVARTLELKDQSAGSYRASDVEGKENRVNPCLLLMSHMFLGTAVLAG